MQKERWGLKDHLNNLYLKFECPGDREGVIVYRVQMNAERELVHRKRLMLGIIAMPSLNTWKTRTLWLNSGHSVYLTARMVLASKLHAARRKLTVDPIITGRNGFNDSSFLSLLSIWICYFKPL